MDNDPLRRLTDRVEAWLWRTPSTPSMTTAQRQQAPVPALWTAPDGTPRTGLVVPTAAASAGTGILIETDAHGTPLPPAVGPDATTNAVLAALM
jgi:hypothetical protein